MPPSCPSAPMIPTPLAGTPPGPIVPAASCLATDGGEQRTLEKRTVVIELSSGVNASGDGVKLTIKPTTGGEQSTLEADVVLVSAGRVPYTSGLSLRTIGIETNKACRINVDKKFMTSVPGVNAIGDVIPRPMLGHKAEEDGVAYVEFIAGKEGKEGHVDYDKVSGVMYTHPEVASVGMTEEQVKASGVAYWVGKFPFLANSHTKAIDDAKGLVKIIADQETDRVLGVHIMSPNAGELIHEAVLVLQYGSASEDIARTCPAHPTMRDAVKEAAMATNDKDSSEELPISMMPAPGENSSLELYRPQSRP